MASHKSSERVTCRAVAAAVLLAYGLVGAVSAETFVLRIADDPSLWVGTIDRLDSGSQTIIVNDREFSLAPGARLIDACTYRTPTAVTLDLMGDAIARGRAHECAAVVRTTASDDSLPAAAEIRLLPRDQVYKRVGP